MTAPNIDTFEHDISDEIKNKEATIGDIAAATGNVGNIPQTDHRSTLFIIIVSILLLCGIIAVVIFWYIQYVNKPQTSLQTQIKATTQGPAYKTIPLNDLSPTLEKTIGRFITNVQHVDYGYSMTITSYPPVFAYMLKNENEYADEIARAVGYQRDTSTTTLPFIFTDVTINNQNMRVGTSGSSTVVYAFINTYALVISSSTKDALSLRSVILH
ncbi:MAG: hypothetical protein WCT07_01320 [Candidatus Paceibacterota bacterium]